MQLSMQALRSKLVNMLLWFWGGTVYFFIEVIWKTATNHPERISWIMLAVAILLSAVLERCGNYSEWEWPLWCQAILSTIVITVVEFITGMICNVWLGMCIWDYSHLPLNIYGQICPQYCLVWLVFSFVFIPVFDWMRYIIDGCAGDRPTYCMK